jgi:two-component system CheB/CheR fusion protein
MARVKKSAPDAAPQSPESETSSTTTKAVSKNDASAGGKRRPGSPGPGRVPASRQKATDPNEIEGEPSLVVGLGASAGGYEALAQFFPALPPDTGMAFVVVQHLDPMHESLLPELIAKVTKMWVSQVKDRTQVKANQVYVIPPNTLMTITDKRLCLNARSRERKPQMSIDHFFRSLAESHDGNAIGIILSGSSSDGALGIEAIKHAGGITFAQEEKSARYLFMPRSAIATGCVDFVLSPEDIAKKLAEVARHPYLSRSHPAKVKELPVKDKNLGRILGLLNKASGVDLTHYKRSTIWRRIMRRMALIKITKPEDYIRYLQENPMEVTNLYQDVLIKVTGFFRDPEAFEVLKNEIFPLIRRQKSPGIPVRIWVPGCSTGEEAYSLAMTWLEYLGDQAPAIPIQVFATDVSTTVIEKARNGLYPENIAEDVSLERLARFFVKTNGALQVSKVIRDMCIFAQQNLIQDAPFSKLDLISCRNVLIYLERVLQKRVLQIFHFALKPMGFLMVGASETIGQFSEFFSLTNRKYKIYRRKAHLGRMPLALGRDLAGGMEPIAKHPGAQGALSRKDIYKEVDSLMLNRFAPPGVLVNEEMEILQFRGETGAYLEPAPGEASFNLMKMVRKGLLMELHRAIKEARKLSEPITRKNLQVRYDGRLHPVNVQVIPLTPSPAQERFFLVLFEEPPGAAVLPGEVEAPALETGEGAEPKDRLIRGLEQELAATKEYIRSVVEDMETSNEELQAANEEILSTNEEFQSVNEELETAKEELQSANEELSTLNDELQDRNAELGRLNSDLNNFLTSTNIPLVKLGHDLKIRSFTPQAQEVLNLIPADIGRSIGDIKLKIEIPDLEVQTLKVVHSLNPWAQEVKDRDGRWYSLQIRPYRTIEDKIEGAVLILIDIDAQKRMSMEVEASRDFIQALFQTMRESMLVLDRDLRVQLANENFYKTFNVLPEETNNRYIYELGNHQWDIPELRTLLEDILPKETSLQDYRVDHNFPLIGERVIMLNARRILQDSPAAEQILLTMEDVTARDRAENKLKESEIKLKKLTSQILVVQEMERQHLSLRLREEVGQALGALKIQIRLVAEKLLPEQKEQKRVSDEASKNINDIINELRRLSRTLSPAILMDLGFTAALKYLVNEFIRDHDIKCVANIDELNDLVVLPEQKITYYRILQEALCNAGHHAEPSKVTVTIKHQDDAILFKVEDNGRGFKVDEVMKLAPDHRFGLAAMEERVQMLGGHLKIWSQEGKGTRISFSAPVVKE